MLHRGHRESHGDDLHRMGVLGVEPARRPSRPGTSKTEPRGLIGRRALPCYSWRRGRDLNPRRTLQHVRDFQSRSLDRSDTSPSARSLAATLCDLGGVAERSNAAVSKTVTGR